MAKPLTQKQVRALARALQRRGRRLPAVGQCVVLSKPRVDGRDPIAGAAGEVCRNSVGYYHVGGLRRYKAIEQGRKR